jgi:hypothetical protein
VLSLRSSKSFIILDHDVDSTKILQRVKSTCRFPVPVASWLLTSISQPYMNKGNFWMDSSKPHLDHRELSKASEGVHSILIEHIATSPLIKARATQVAAALAAFAR